MRRYRRKLAKGKFTKVYDQVYEEEKAEYVNDYYDRDIDDLDEDDDEDGDILVEAQDRADIVADEVVSILERAVAELRNHRKTEQTPERLGEYFQAFGEDYAQESPHRYYDPDIYGCFPFTT
jgi:hypothetical protein